MDSDDHMYKKNDIASRCRAEWIRIGYRVRRLLMLTLLLTVCLVPLTAHAENMITVAKGNRISGGKFVTDAKGIRYRKKSGKYIRNKWVTIKKNVYMFRKNGYARRDTFFTYRGQKYYADKDGIVQHKKWIKKGKKAYYLKADGTLAAGETLELSGKKYVFRKSGALNTKKSDEPKSDKYLFVGDSRVVGMSMFAPHDKAEYIGEVSMGYSYLASSAGPQVKRIISRTPNINVIFCFGINDLGNAASYISYYKSLIKAHPKTDFYFMSINPISRGATAYLSNSLIEAFNKKLKKAVGKKKYLDTYTYLTENGFGAWDGVHYNGETYLKIYQYTVKEIESR